MQAVLARIDAINPDVNAIVTLARESALREARRATATLRRGAALSPLFGVPVGIKDVTATKGIRATYGSKLFDAHVPDEDALVVERLRAAGAIVIGKTNTPEFAFGPNTVNTVFGATRNPWNLALTAGGSSGGPAAAPPARLCPPPPRNPPRGPPPRAAPLLRGRRGPPPPPPLPPPPPPFGRGTPSGG